MTLALLANTFYHGQVGCRILPLRGSCSLAGATILTLSLSAEVVQVQQIRLGAKSNQAAKFSTRIDTGPRFATVVSPAGNVLSLVAKDSGNWELYRVRSWLESPFQEKLVIPGFPSKKDKPDMSSLDAFVSVTSDGAYAICASSASWYQGPSTRPLSYTADDVIAVVDLSGFTVIRTIHTRDTLGLFTSRSIKLDHEDRVLLHSSDFIDGQWRHAFVRLAIPSLAPGPVCHYVWVGDPPRQRDEATTVDDCQAALKPSVALEEYRKREIPTGTELFPSWQRELPSVCTHKGLDQVFSHVDEDCHWYKLTDDKKFGIAERSVVRLNIILDWYSRGSSTYIVFNATKDLPIGEIPIKNSSPAFRFAMKGEHDYLIVIENGTLLTIYELRE